MGEVVKIHMLKPYPKVPITACGKMRDDALWSTRQWWIVNCERCMRTAEWQRQKHGHAELMWVPT